MISNMLRFPLSMLDEEMDRWFFPEMFGVAGARLRAGYPPLNIGATDKGIEAYLFAPGMDPQALDIVIEKNMLSVEGERKLPEVSDKEGESYRQERFSGRFKRVVTLPEDVDPDSAEATYRDGVLHISIAKRPEAQKRQIPVSVN